MSPSAAEEDLTRVHKNLIDARPQNANTTPAVLPLRERFVGGYQSAGVVSGLAVGVLALACATIAALALVTTVASGLLPAATMSRTEPMSVLRRTHTGATAGRGPRRVLYALSGVQVTLATTLLSVRDSRPAGVRACPGRRPRLPAGPRPRLPCPAADRQLPGRRLATRVPRAAARRHAGGPGRRHRRPGDLTAIRRRRELQLL